VKGKTLTATISRGASTLEAIEGPHDKSVGSKTGIDTNSGPKTGVTLKYGGQEGFDINVEW